ncbi:MAG: putative metal-binding motif-containing protein [Myxococcales bacterium]|nr:putative metal-binding motif-containing protein [Myxococcales bacterium]MDD9971376.1 putative metal-binding motif-containing protein [Myxococcales bacterium]
MFAPVSSNDGRRGLLSKNGLSWVLVACAAAAASGSAQAQCDDLNVSISDHSCFHARLGPFEDVSAGYADGPPTSDNLDHVHTHYRISLPAAGSVDATTASIPYTPARSGDWAVFMEYPIPLEVLDDDGRALDVGHQASVPTCPFFEHVGVYTLDGGQTYEFAFELTSATSSVVVLEKIDDFLEFHGRDRDGDGYGDPEGVQQSACLPPPGYVANDGDCDDTDPEVHPEALELCDSVDRNCNGSSDDTGAPCTAGQGACAVDGTSVCDEPEAPTICMAEPLQPGAELCNGVDDDCDGASDETLDALCRDEHAPRCVPDGTGLSFCGCEADADCGGPRSGQLCVRDGVEQHCAEGCVDGFGRNGCPAHLHCTSADPTHPGKCVSSREPPERDAGPEPGVTQASRGCQCRVAGTPGCPDEARAPLAFGGLVLATLVSLSRRRSRTRGGL